MKFIIRDTQTMKLSKLDDMLMYPFESMDFESKIELCGRALPK